MRVNISIAGPLDVVIVYRTREVVKYEGVTVLEFYDHWLMMSQPHESQSIPRDQIEHVTYTRIQEEGS